MRRREIILSEIKTERDSTVVIMSNQRLDQQCLNIFRDLLLFYLFHL